jgi:hypothetical protein
MKYQNNTIRVMEKGMSLTYSSYWIYLSLSPSLVSLNRYFHIYLILMFKLYFQGAGVGVSVSYISVNEIPPNQ